MFGGRKAYAPVRSYDSETGGRGSPRSRKSSGSWKKYAILGGVAVGVLIFVGSGHYRRGRADEWELEEGGQYEGGQSSSLLLHSFQGSQVVR